MLSTKEGQAAADEFRTKFAEPEEKKLQAKQAEITDLNDKLQRGANTMSQTAQDDMKKSLDRKNTEYKRAVEDYQFDHDEEQRKLLDDLSAKMQSVIARFAQENACAMFHGRDQPEFGNHVDLGHGRRDAADRGRLRQSAARGEQLPKPAARAKPPATSRPSRLPRLRPSRRAAPPSSKSRADYRNARASRPASTLLLRTSFPEST